MAYYRKSVKEMLQISGGKMINLHGKPYTFMMMHPWQPGDYEYRTYNSAFVELQNSIFSQSTGRNHAISSPAASRKILPG
ncbi:MAG: hypothetical protein R2850_00110 [Bacteroidia bacterium]